MISIVTPVKNEGENVIELYERIARSLTGTEYEIIFMDSSTDDTSELLHHLAVKDNRVHFYRAPSLNLGEKVVLGMRLSHGKVIAVMDSDLQHPPEVLPTMLKAIDQGEELVIPSRLMLGGAKEGLTNWRKATSWGARKTGQLFLHSLRTVSDPTGGFFMLRREVIDGVDLNPIGWKILMEILVKGRYRCVSEIPYHFQTRERGESKFSIKEQWNYLRHVLALLKVDRSGVRGLLFAMVGLSGIGVNMLVFGIGLYFFTSSIMASSLAFSAATLTNFIGNNKITWGDVREGKTGSRFRKYLVSTLIGYIINIILLYTLQTALGRVRADLIGIGAGMIANYLLSSLWTWKSHKKIIVRSVSEVAA